MPRRVSGLKDLGYQATIQDAHVAAGESGLLECAFTAARDSALIHKSSKTRYATPRFPMTIENRSLNRYAKAIRGRRIGVVGDLMLDRYLWGSASRLSPARSLTQAQSSSP